MILETLELGTMGYQECHDLQNRLLEEVAAETRPSTLVFVEHPPVFSLGAGFHPENLLLPSSTYQERGFDVFPTDRGGDVTYHGPGQLVAYPIFDLRLRNRDLHRWLRDLEEIVIRTIGEFGLEGYRFAPHTGVWTKGSKICAIGIKVRRWVSKHGIALNCRNDLSPFDLIVPCGIKGYGVTSLSRELGRDVAVAEVKPVLEAKFREVFEAADPRAAPCLSNRNSDSSSSDGAS